MNHCKQQKVFMPLKYIILFAFSKVKILYLTSSVIITVYIAEYGAKYGVSFYVTSLDSKMSKSGPRKTRNDSLGNHKVCFCSINLKNLLLNHLLYRIKREVKWYKVIVLYVYLWGLICGWLIFPSCNKYLCEREPNFQVTIF